MNGYGGGTVTRQSEQEGTVSVSAFLRGNKNLLYIQVFPIQIRRVLHCSAVRTQVSCV
jgi:hypothetical protein